MIIVDILIIYQIVNYIRYTIILFIRNIVNKYKSDNSFYYREIKKYT